MSTSVAQQPISVSLGSCKKLRSSRGAEQFMVLAKIEYGGEMVGEPNKLDCNDKETVDLALTATLNCSITNPADLDELARTPLIVSVSEVLPKDKKAKEDKAVTIGMASIDLSPLLQGQQGFQLSALLYPLEPSGDDEDLPEVDISISVPVPLISMDEFSRSNLMYFRVRGLYSLPDSWSTGQGSFNFTVATCKPGTQSGDTPLVMGLMGGKIHGPSDPNLAASKGKWRWTGTAGALNGVASLLPGSLLMVQAVEDESGDLRSPQDIEFRRHCERSKPRVVWNAETRCFLSTSETETLMRDLSRCSIWPVEMTRVISAPSGKGKSKEDDIQMSLHGVAYMDLSSLLYAGATRVFGAYPVVGFSETDQSDRTEHRNIRSILDIVHPKPNTTANVGSRKSTVSKPRPITASRRSMVSLVSESLADEPKLEGHVYEDARSYLLLEMELAKPLVPKRPASVIADRIAEYIPPRPSLPKTIGGTEKAIRDFHSATSDVASFLFHEYRILFGDEVRISSTKQEMEERQQKLIYHLNSTGRYHAFKEHLKKAVVNLVRQKFLNEASVQDQGQLQEFLSKLYVYLVDEMHSGLSRVFSVTEFVSQQPSVLDNDMVKHFAEEAVAMQDMDLAEYYYKELLARADHLSSHWYEYGVFNLLVDRRDKSEQCFRRAISLDQQFVPGLLLFGMCVSIDERFSEAEEVFELATTIDSNNIIAWIVRGLYYEHCNNRMYRDMCFKEAHQLAMATCKKTYITTMLSGVGGREGKHSNKGDKSGQQSLGMTVNDAGSQTGGTQTQVPVEESPEQAGVNEVNLDPQPASPSCDESTQEGELTLDNEHTTSSSTLIPEPSQEAKKEEEAKPSINPFLLTASYLVDVHASKYAEMCLAHEMVGNESIMQQDDEESGKAVKKKGTSVPYLIAVGRLLILRKQYERANDYLSRAVKEQVENSSALALLGHCCYLSGDLDKAKNYYERVIHYVQLPPMLYVVLLRLADIYMRDKEYKKAKETYLQACRKSPSSVTWRGVGIACYMMGEYSEAEDALSEANILNNLDPVVWAYLVLLCQHTHRPSEAEQALKFAIKTGLQVKDPSLFSQLQSTQ